MASAGIEDGFGDQERTCRQEETGVEPIGEDWLRLAQEQSAPRPNCSEHGGVKWQRELGLPVVEVYPSGVSGAYPI